MIAFALGFAYLLEYGYGHAPCPLCLYQRYPYFAVIAVAAVAFATGFARLGVVLAMLLVLVSGGVGYYHAGVEAGIFALSPTCAGVGEASSVDELKAQLAAAPPRCDQVSVAFLGLSLALWNGILATLAGLASLGVLIRDWRTSPR